MIQFPSDHKDAKNGNQHVAGSQSAANDQCAQNMREGAINFRASKAKGPTTGRVVQSGQTKPPINVAGVLLLLIGGMTLVAAFGMVFK